MNESDGLIAAVAANRDDDSPRLVYADWLEERGINDRAELIRVECALAVLPSTAPERIPLAARSAELIRKNEDLWLRPLYPYFVHARTQRGFVHAISMQAVMMLQHPPVLPPEWPVLWELSIIGVNRQVPLIVQRMPVAPVIRWQSMNVRTAELIELVRSSLMAAEELDLRFNALTDDAIDVLASEFPRTQRFALGGNLISPAGRARAQQLLGNRCSFDVARADDYRYTLMTDDRIIVGRDAEQRATMITRAPDESNHAIIYRFDDVGVWVDKEIGPPGFSSIHRVPIADDPAVRNFCAKLGLTPQPIAVRRFHDDVRGVRLTDLTERQEELCLEPPDPRDAAQDARWAEYERLRNHWMPRGNFDLRLGNR